MRRVVITGLGTVNALGLDVATSYPRILAGENGVTTLDRFDTTGITATIAAQVDWSAADCGFAAFQRRAQGSGRYSDAFKGQPHIQNALQMLRDSRSMDDGAFQAKYAASSALEVLDFMLSDFLRLSHNLLARDAFENPVHALRLVVNNHGNYVLHLARGAWRIGCRCRAKRAKGQGERQTSCARTSRVQPLATRSPNFFFLICSFLFVIA